MIEAAYIPTGDNPLRVSSDLVDRLAADTGRTVLLDHLVPVRSGYAFTAPAGSIVRFESVDGPQVLDVNIWSSTDPRERFWASRSRQMYGSHVTVGDRLWSCLPFLRPLVTIIADSMHYGIDSDGAGCHDLLGTRCDPYVTSLLAGVQYDYCCHSNLTRAVRNFGLTEFDVHDVINLFQVTGLLPGDDERYYIKASPAVPGDHVELLVETDLLVAVSTCPGGDLSVPQWGPDAGAEAVCNPIRATVLQPSAAALDGWAPSVRADYRGMGDGRHGLGITEGTAPHMTEAIPNANVGPA